MKLLKPHAAALALLVLLAGCAHPALREAETLTRSNQLAQAHQVLAQALAQQPEERALRAAELRSREQLQSRLLVQAEGLRAVGRWDEAAQVLERLRALDPRHPRLEPLATEIARGQRQEQKLAEARQWLRQGRLDAAEAVARAVLAESAAHPAAQGLLSQVAQARPLEAQTTAELGPAFAKAVTLEFREATLRQVFEALARSSSINFVFDKDVRSDTKVTVFLRQVTVDEALRVILATQQLDRKLLNDNSVLVYPNTPAKQREHQELITRTLYLTNADVKQVQAMVRSIAKVRDIHIDERLNLMVVRDTPEVMRLVERLIASVDLPEAEVMLEVEVMEVASDRLDDLGLQWPETIQYGLPGVVDQISLSQRDSFRGSVANPALVAKLKGTAGQVNLLANPKIRVRNREKAKVHIGEKLPVFTTTTAVNVGTAASVSYLDVGLKLDVEPLIQLDNEVSIKVGLEVSNLIRQVAGPNGSVAYQIGTRQTSTVLRLADGETQVLAGLINDEDRRSAAGIPGLSAVPMLGALFGVQSSTRNKTEVVLLITPRVVRSLGLPDAGSTRLPAGTDGQPGARGARIGASGMVALAPGSATPGPALAPQRPTLQAQPQAAAAAAAAAADAEVLVQLNVAPRSAPGAMLGVTLRHDSAATVRGELEYDPQLLQPARNIPEASPGRLPFELRPRSGQVMMLRVLPAAAGQALTLSVGGLSASGSDGSSSPPVRVEGSGLVSVEAAR